MSRKRQLWLRISSLMLVFVFMIASSNINAMAASLLSISAKASSSEVSIGQEVVISATATGGSGKYTYSFLVCNKTTGKWARLTEKFTTSNTYTWKAQSEGKREFFVEVKDSTGKVVRSKAIPVNTSNKLSVNASTSSSTVELGSTIKLTAKATGGSGKYTYSFLVFNKKTGKWARLTEKFTTSNIYTWKAKSEGEREFFVEVKDSTGKVVRSKAIEVNTGNKLSVSASASSSAVELGSTIKLTAKATGGSGSYTYSYIVYNKNTGKWARLADNITKNTYTWKAKDCADRIFYIDVKDSTSKVVRSKALNVSVVNKMTVTANADDTEGEIGQNIKLTAKAIGGSGAYRYSYIVFNKNTKEWYRLADSITAEEYTWTVNDIGERVFYIDVKDLATGKVVRSNAINIVVPDKISVTGVKLNNREFNLKADSSEKLTATVLPSNADDKSVVWSSSDQAVATVDNNGLVKAVENGEAVITVKTVDGGYEATCKVYVTTPVTGIIVNMDTVDLEVGMGIMILDTILPSTASNQSVIWSSSNPNIVTVNEKGYAEAIANGEATITVTTVDGGFTASCKVKTLTVTDGVSLNTSTLNLNAGAGSQLVATVKPETASNKSVTWSSSNTAVATVNGNGYVTAVGNGTATITVRTAEGGKTASCTVTVRTVPTGVSLNATTLNLNAGAGAQLTATVSPGTASNKSVTWRSSNTAVATVNGNGYVTAVGNGTATITVTTAEGGKAASCTVTVRTAPTGVSLSASTLNLNAGAGAQLTATVSPGTASNKSVTWSSSNTAVATVNGSGYVTAVGNGTATITVKTAESGKTASCTVTVRTAPTGVSLNASTLNLNAGAGAQLTATVSPGTASNKSVTWSSSNTAVATVNGSGYVTAVGNGTATITVKTAESGKTASCTVTVRTAPTGVSLNASTLNLNAGAGAQLTATVSPGTASNKSVTWSSSNTAVATVNGSGYVTAVGNGTATITVKTAEGGKIASCTVNVTTKPTGVSITNKKNVILDCDSSSKTYQCNITVSPSTASNKSVTWSSSNTGVATVNGNGLITAAGVGTATITVKTNASGHQDTINVYVYESKAVAPGGTFRVSIGSTTNRVMDVDKANAYDGAKVQLYSVNSSLGQMWEFHDYSQSNGGYAIVPMCQSNGRILDVNRGNSYSDPLQAGCKVDLWLIGQDNPASMFDLVRFWDGSYAFKLINSNLVVGVTSTEECTQLVAKNFDVNDMNQRWFLEKVDVSNNTASEGVEKAISWAQQKMNAGDMSYCYWCLRFIGDAFRQGGIDNVHYSTATQAGNALITNTDTNPPRGAVVFWDWYGTIDGIYANYGHVGISLGNGQVIHADYNGIKITGLSLGGRPYRGWGTWK